jgi:hypothetical protein
LPPCRIESKFSTFRKGVKRAAKRHPSFVVELTKILSEIEKDSTSVGNQIPGCDGLHVRKVRIGAPNEQIKPSAGYRLIYEVLQTSEGQWVARCLDLYYKKEQETVKAFEAVRISRQAAVQSNPDSEPE